MNTNPRASDFFIAGGTLRADSPCYVKRLADDELFNLVLAGEFCYVLTPRQMGKSSMMVRTAHRLKEKGVSTVIIDLTSIGTDVSVEQWYLGLITRMKSQLKLSIDPDAWWVERVSLSAVQRFTDFLHDVVLAEVEGAVVVFVDEIDTTLNLSFSDDFFAAVRFTYNARASDPAYNRLTFVLLGVAAPADLIKDPSRTPFNIGHRVDLHEFSREDAQVLQQGLEAICPEHGGDIFARIFDWTNGHPYLTQKLCLAVAEAGDGRWTEKRIDELVEKLFLSEQARKETNLQFVRNKILTHPQRRHLLNLYRRVHTGERIRDDERSPHQSQLKLSGLIKVEGGYLHIRNEIYRRAFDLAWVRENTAVNWAPIVAGISVFVAVLAVGVIFYNVWVGIQFRDCIANFYQANTLEERIVPLAKAFKLRGFLVPTDYDYKARELFYGLPPEEQLALFDVHNVRESDLLVIMRGLYGTLADIDGTDSTRPLLEAMVRALDCLDGTEDAIALRDEIDSWLKGRELVRQNLYPEAREAYDKAIALNGENPATLYERARVLIELSEYEQALNDLDQVMGIARRAPAPTPTPLPTIITPAISAVPTATGTPKPATATLSIQTPSVGEGTLPLSTPAASMTTVPTTSPVPAEATPVPVSGASEFATFGQMISAVRSLIYNNPDLVNLLANASSSEYPNLRESGLVPTPTPLLTPAIASFFIYEPPQLDAQEEKSPVGGYLECSGVDLSILQVVVYITGVEPELATMWWRSEVPCPPTKSGPRWELPAHCVSFPLNYSTFRLIAILTKGDRVESLPTGLRTEDAAELRDRLLKYTYLGNAECISPEFDVKRKVSIAAATNTPTNTLVPPTETPTPTPSETPTPTSTATNTPTSPPTATATPAPPTSTPIPAAPILTYPENGYEFPKGPVTLKWEWPKPLGPYTWFSVHARMEGDNQDCFHDHVGGPEYHGGLGDCTAGKVWWRVLVAYSPTESPPWTEISEPSEERWFIYTPGTPPLPSPVVGTPIPEPSASPVPAGQVRISDVLGRGNLIAEIVVIFNTGRPIRLKDWTLSDDQGHIFTFPDLFLGAEGNVRVHTTGGQNSVTDLYWGQSTAVWAEPGDVATLRDANGVVVYILQLP